MNDTPPTCAGNSSLGATRSAAGNCPAPPLYSITVGKLVRYTCGRHVGWMLQRMTVPGWTATVLRLEHPL